MLKYRLRKTMEVVMESVQFDPEWIEETLRDYKGRDSREWEGLFDWGSCYPLYDSIGFVGVVCSEFGEHENGIILGLYRAFSASVPYEIVRDRYAASTMRLETLDRLGE